MGRARGSHPCSPRVSGCLCRCHAAPLLSSHGGLVLFYSYILDAERPEARGLSKAGEKAWGWVMQRIRFDGDGDFSAVSKEHLGSAYSWPSYLTQPGGWQSRTGVPSSVRGTRPCGETTPSARRTRLEGQRRLQTRTRQAPASLNTGCFPGGACLSLGRLFTTSTDM